MTPPPRGPIRAGLICVALALSVGYTLPAPRAAADGDPASDVLLAEDIFYPYTPRVSSALMAAVQKTLHAASAAGVHLKIAIIGSVPELGLVPNFFGHPQAYARFLDREITFNGPQPLLVVMPAGFGVIPANLADALTGMPVDSTHGSDGLARSAILAVVALARHQGHPIAAPEVASSSSRSSTPVLLVFVLPAAVLVLAGLGLFLRDRRRSTRAANDGRS